MSRIFRISVRDIIEFVMKKGDLDDRFVKSTRAIEGTLAHQKIQKENEKIFQDYEKEVSITEEFELENNIKLNIYGRIDGVIKESNSIIIEEIKSTIRELSLFDENTNELYWMQGKFYAYMYCLQNKLSEITIRLTYYNIENFQVRSFDKSFDVKSLKENIFKVIKEYEKWLVLKSRLEKNRDESVKKLMFPFDKYRKGQREIVNVTYNTIKEKGKIFIQGPTGVGKTISTIFPAIKAIGNGLGKRVVYITAKTITRTVAEKTFSMLEESGLEFSSITLTAKEKICLNSKVSCNPIDCEFAKKYFEKINEVVFEILCNEKTITRKVVEKYGKKYTVCPFELSLELSEWCDGIICDYNYVFDPRVNLKRLYEKKGNILLVDEAHNLVDRGREMFSAEIGKKEILDVCKLTKGKNPKLHSNLNSINKYMISIRREMEFNNEQETYSREKLTELGNLITKYLLVCDEYFERTKEYEEDNRILELYFSMKKFQLIMNLYSSEHVTLYKRSRFDLNIKLYCTNPRNNIKEITDKFAASIIFSATLEPMKYYIDLLGGDETSYRIKSEAPFKEENLKKYILPINMRYNQREKNIPILCESIEKFISQEKGNTMVFFPSYIYMKTVSKFFQEKYTDRSILIQEEGITEEGKEDFLNLFRNESEKVAFCVIGGIFSEGIDLPGEALTSVIVIGVGFPQVSIERKIIMEHFKEVGFEYSYVYPGINKVLQCIGRVIRREEDKGALLLIDDRYKENRYRELLPNEWKIQNFK